ncbi:MAG: hypothetical protein ABS81_04380 [Pseudonocardia sp. SCN 72-86]|nr:MAG: hypothetical protein ABS81_04380 [Pseudonocardia sp. SCN 72-86]
MRPRRCHRLHKRDAIETSEKLLENVPNLPDPKAPLREDLLASLVAHGVEQIGWTDWLRLDAEEVRLGVRGGADRVKVAELEAMIAACRGSRGLVVSLQRENLPITWHWHMSSSHEHHPRPRRADPLQRSCRT